MPKFGQWEGLSFLAQDIKNCETVVTLEKALVSSCGLNSDCVDYSILERLSAKMRTTHRLGSCSQSNLS